jgi:hypothetical protein
VDDANQAAVLAGAGPVVRAAKPDDLDALVTLELRAFRDVYGNAPDPMTVTSVRASYAGRLSLIGRWARVLETATASVVGMLLCLPIRRSRLEVTELLEQGPDLADVDVLRSLFDESGTALWTLNLAVLDGQLGSGSLYLTADMRAMARAHGIRHIYFRSRLPGFARWLAEQCPRVDQRALPKASRDALAQRYWRSTVRRGGVDRPVDPLMAMHVDLGCAPLSLVPGWAMDRPSLGYAVLFESPYGTTQAPRGARDR